MDPEQLNDDQNRTMKTLPALEAVQKELAEVKKAIEVRLVILSYWWGIDFFGKVHELEQAQELTLKRVEAEKAEKQRITDAVSAVKVCVSEFRDYPSA